MVRGGFLRIKILWPVKKLRGAIRFTKFQNKIGTTQTDKFGKLENFGGFTDGDRCVFLAETFKPKKIILFGMDFGNKIGKYSKKKVIDKKTKLKKLEYGLLENLTLNFILLQNQLEDSKRSV